MSYTVKWKETRREENTMGERKKRSAKRIVALAALTVLGVAALTLAVMDLQLKGLVDVEAARTPTPVPPYGNVMQVTIDPSQPTPVPVLRSGAQGMAVWQMQERLQALGFYTRTVDGQFGPATREAVIAFQRQHGLMADGIVGEETREMMDSSAAQTAAPTVTPNI